MGTSSKYEAVGSVGTASVASVIVPAGNAGDIGLGNRSLAGVIQSEVIDPCLAPTTFLASASRSATSSEASEHASSHAMAFAPGPMSARDDDTWRVKALGVGSSIVNPSDAGISWPPADVAQWLDQELNCGTLGTGFLGGPTREGA